VQFVLTTKSARIIVLTTHDSDEDIYRGLQAGAKGYLLKETEPDELLPFAPFIGVIFRPMWGKVGSTPQQSRTERKRTEGSHSLAQGMSNAEIAAALDMVKRG